MDLLWRESVFVVAYQILGPIYEGPVSAAGWTVPDQDISERCRNARPSDHELNANLFHSLLRKPRLPSTDHRRWGLCLCWIRNLAKHLYYRSGVWRLVS